MILFGKVMLNSFVFAGTVIDRDPFRRFTNNFKIANYSVLDNEIMGKGIFTLIGIHYNTIYPLKNLRQVNARILS